MGELTDLATPTALRRLAPIPAGVELFKIGLAGCSSIADWPSRWRDVVAALRNSDRAAPPQPVAVVYADGQSAGAPSPDDILRAAIELHCPALLIDTWNKSAGNLFDHFPESKLCSFLDRARSQKLMSSWPAPSKAKVSTRPYNCRQTSSPSARPHATLAAMDKYPEAEWTI